MSGADALIHSSAWSNVLAMGFGATSLMLHDHKSGIPITWTIFSKFGIRVAYANFPVGLDDHDITENVNPILMFDGLRAAGVDIARFSTTSITNDSNTESFRRVDLVETCIYSLECWSENKLPAAVARKLKKGMSHGLEMRQARSADASIIYDLYASTISRHRGSLRYTRKYFQALCDLGTIDDRLSIGMAIDKSQNPCGFIVVCHSPSVSHYLHGGFSPLCANARPGYFAMAWAIRRGKEYGSSRFNMLTSPPDQSSLVAYKESFGGESYLRRHFDVPLSRKGRATHLGLNVLANHRLIFRA